MIKEELKTPIVPAIFDKRAQKVLMWGAEAMLLGPCECNSVHLLDRATEKGYISLVYDMAQISRRLAGGAGPGMVAAPHSTGTILATVDFTLRAIAESPDAFVSNMGNVPLKTFDLLLSALDFNDIGRELAADGSRINAAVLKDVMRFLSAMIRLGCDFNVETVKYAVQEVLIPFANSSPTDAFAPFRLASIRRMYCFIIGLFDDSGFKNLSSRQFRASSEGMQLASLIYKSFEASAWALERAGAAAEAVGDHARLALAIKELVMMLMHSMRKTRVSDIKTLISKNTAALAAARSWLPRTIRLLISAESIGDALINDADHSIISFWLLYTIAGPLGARPPESTPGMTVERRAALQTCSNCFEHSYNYMACSGCRSCLPYQKMHWKAGHKAECAALKAKREAEEAEAAAAKAAAKAAEAAERAAAEEAAAAAARPSTSGSGRVNNKKKKGKKKGGAKK